VSGVSTYLIEDTPLLQSAHKNLHVRILQWSTCLFWR